MIKKILIPAIFILVVSCGFQPILKEIDNVDIKIQKINFIGKTELIYEIKNKLGLLENTNSNGLILTLKIEENRFAINKNSSGVATEEQLRVSIDLTVSDNNNKNLLTEKISESARFQLSDNLVNDDAEKNSILNNLIEILAQKIKFKLIILTKNLK